MKSILPADFNGVMDVTGAFGIGKTWLAVEADLPQNVVLFDYDHGKGAGLDAQLNLGLYMDMTKAVIGKPGAALWEHSMKVFSELPQDKFTVAVLDDATTLMKSCKVYVQSHAALYQTEYGIRSDFIERDTQGNARGIVNMEISKVINTLHNRGVRLVIVTHHLGAKYAAGVEVPNKFRIKGYKNWQQASILTIVLIPGDKPPTPAGLIRKEQLGAIAVNRDPSPEELDAMLAGESGHTKSRRLPFRMPECTFQKVRWYLRNPADLQKPAPGEEIRPAEVALYDESLSNEQIAFVSEAAKVELIRLADERESAATPFGRPTVKPKTDPDAEIKAKAKEMETDELTGTALAKAVAEAMGLPYGKVKKALK